MRRTSRARRLAFRTALFWLAVSATSGCRRSSEHVVLKLGHALDQNHPVHGGMAYMAELIEERSQGRIQVQIFASEQLGSERELLELLQVGGVAMAKVGGMVLENFQPSMAVFSLPYLFESPESFWKVLDGPVGQELLEETSRYGLKGLCYYDSGSRSFYTADRAVLRPEDLQGLKIRVPNSATSIEMIRELGGSATPIAFGELYSALQQKVVDGAENNPPSLYFSRHFEVCEYYILDEHTRVPDVLLMSADTWERLTPEFREIVEKAARDSVPYQRRLWDEAVDHSMQELRKAGVKILRPDRKPFVEAARPMLHRYQGGEFSRLIARIQEAQTK